MLDAALLLFAFSAGVLAFLNPCGIALLPAFVAYYLKKGQNRVLDALKVGVSVSLGFFVAFSLAAAIVLAAGSFFLRYAPSLAILIGGLLVALGVFMLLGKTHLSLPLISSMGHGLQQKAPSGLKSFFLYGLGYGLASLSCTLPVFLAVMGQALTLSVVSEQVTFGGVYVLGATLLIVTASVASAVAKNALEKSLHRMLPHVNRAAAAFIILAGLYTIWIQVSAYIG